MNPHSAARPVALPRRFLLVASLVLSVATATAATTKATAEDAPPFFNDAAHVLNGCHLSSIAYLARFTAEFPAERGEPVVLIVPNGDGVKRPHTIALLTWKGTWWGRDEYFGVFRIGARVDSGVTADDLTDRATTLISRISSRASRNAGYRRPPVATGRLSSAELSREATVAASLIPHPSTTYWITDGGREYPLVFFRPSPGTIAVYDPHRGTGVAECAATDDSRVVAMVAARLGYNASSVRAEVPALPAAFATVAAR